MWSSHVSNICNKTRRLIGILYRRFYKHSSPNTLLRLYTSFIRPHLEYAAAAWDPFLKKDIALLEDVQKFALRVCTKTWDTSYDDLLLTSHLPPLQERRQQSKLRNLFNIINELTFFPDAPTQVRQQIYPRRSVHARAIVPLQSHSLQYYNSFFPSAIAAWNSLPSSVVSATSWPAFKQALCSQLFIS